MCETMKAEPSNPGADVPAAPARLGKPTGPRKWLYRLAAMTLVPALLFGAVEIGLRVGGYGYPTSCFLDGSEVEGPGWYVENRDFSRRFFPPGLAEVSPPPPARLEAVKPAGTYRIFVLGESAAMGFPDPSSSFPRVLEVLLRDRYPQTRFEVVNASMVAVNSHVLRATARECARYQPDLFVVHLGNNEVVGPFGAANVLGSSAPNLTLIRAHLLVRTTRTGQLLGDVMHRLARRPAGAEEWKGMATFAAGEVRADDPSLSAVYDHFRANLEDICAAGTGARAPVVLCTIPVNLKDSAPFASLHAPGLDAERTAAWQALYEEGAALEGDGRFTDALARYEEAARVDDRFADLEFRRARCLAALGRGDGAREAYRRARDLDALRFRSDTTINETVRRVAAAWEAKGVRLADAERAFDEASPAGVPGEEFFLEHVHMNFSGNYLLARTVLRQVEELLPESVRPRGAEPKAPLSEEECAVRLAVTPWNRLKIERQIQDMFYDAPFTNQLDRAGRAKRWQARLAGTRARLDAEGSAGVAAAFRKAVEGAPDDWMIRMNFGEFLSESGAPAEAVEQYEATLRALPHGCAAHYQLGRVLLRLGRLPEAATHLKAAFALNPDYTEAYYGLADVRLAQGRKGDAVAIYAERARVEPNRARALAALAWMLSRTGDPAAGKARLEESLRLNPSDPATHAALSEALAAEGNLDDAIAQYEAALQLRPDRPELLGRLAELKAARARRDAAGPK
jgi:tetratricopeptide (TPR) repeat protein